jgi:hypothetical protein
VIIIETRELRAEEKTLYTLDNRYTKGIVQSKRENSIIREVWVF